MSVSSSPSAIHDLSDTQIVNHGPRARVHRVLKQWIADGVLPHGESLPAEQHLADRLQVNRRTLRSALVLLEEEGLLRSNGARRRVVAAPQTEANGLLQDAIVLLTPLSSDHQNAERQVGWDAHLIQGALRAIESAGFHAVTLHPDRLNEKTIEQFARNRPFGVLVADVWAASAQTITGAAKFREHGIPLVLFADHMQTNEFDCVASDHQAGAYELTKWLLSRGRKQILQAWPPSFDAVWAQQRRQGYERALQEAGLEPLPNIAMPKSPAIPGNAEEFSDSVRFLAGYFAEHLSGSSSADALMMISDSYVEMATAACRLFGKTPHQDIDVVGYDNTWNVLAEFHTQAEPPSATMDKRNLEIGLAMVELLLQRIEKKLPAPPQRRVIAPQLIVPEKR